MSDCPDCGYGKAADAEFCSICEINHDNERLRVAIALAVGRLERREAGAALTGLKAALTRSERMKRDR